EESRARMGTPTMFCGRTFAKHASWIERGNRIATIPPVWTCPSSALRKRNSLPPLDSRKQEPPTADRTRNDTEDVIVIFGHGYHHARCIVCVHRTWFGHRWSRSFSETC